MAVQRHPPIPKQYEAGLLKILHMSSKETDVLVSTLEGASPLAKENDLVSLIASKTGLEHDDAQNIVRSLMGLYSAPSVLNVTVPQFIKNVCDAVKHSTDTGSEIPDQQWEQLEGALNKLLSLDDSLGVRSKTYELMIEQEHIFYSARIITDMRPVFSKNLSNRPVSAAIFHTLKIAYGEAGEMREFFVALDDKDIQDLHEDLTRAVQKSSSLKRFLDEGNLPYLEVEDTEA